MNSGTAPEVRLGDWISEGWRMFGEQWKVWVTLSLAFCGAVVVPVAAFVVVMYVSMFATMMAQPGSRGAPPAMPLMTILFFYVGLFTLILVLMPLGVFLIGGSYRAAFKQLRGERVEFGDLFSARDCYWRLLGAALIHFACTTIGAMLCVIPAFIFGGLFFFTMPLIVERDLGVFDAMRASRDVTQRNLMMFTLFAFVVQLIASAGSYACYIGVIASWPLMFTIGVVAYRDCFGVPGARRFMNLSTAQDGYGPVSTIYASSTEQQWIECPKCRVSLPAAAQFCAGCGWNVGAR